MFFWCHFMGFVIRVIKSIKIAFSISSAFAFGFLKKELTTISISKFLKCSLKMQK